MSSDQQLRDSHIERAKHSLEEGITSTSLWDIDDLCHYLKIKRQTIYNWIHFKKIPHIKLHGLLRFEKKAIEEWVISNKVCYEPKEIPEGK